MGIIIGTLISGFLVQKGRRKIIIVSSFIGIVGCVLSCYPTLITVGFGRIVYGVASGILLTTQCIMMNEIVPTHYLDKGFGAFTNLAICFIFVANLSLKAVSTLVNSIQNFSHFWQIVFGFPAFFLLINLMFFGCCHKEDTIYFHIISWENEQAQKIIERIYPKETDYAKSLIFLEL